MRFYCAVEVLVSSAVVVEADSMEEAEYRIKNELSVDALCEEAYSLQVELYGRMEVVKPDMDGFSLIDQMDVL